MNPKELREKLAKIAAETRTMADLIKKENRSFSDEERKKIDGLYAEADSLKTRINDLERAEKLDAELDKPVGDTRIGKNDANHDPEKAAHEARQSGKPVITEEHRGLAIQGWLRRNSVKRLDLTDEHREACKLTGLNPDSSELVIRMPHASYMQRMQRAGWAGGYGNSFQGAEQRALSALIGSTGAYTISQTLINQLEVNMLAFGGVLQACDVIRTAKGEDMFWPTVDDTSNSGRQVGESAAVTSTAQPAFARRAWGAYKFTSDEILVPYELLEDSAFDIPSVLGEMLGERLGRILNTKFTTGTGAATPNGIVTASTAGKTTASGSAITWDEVTDLIHSIDPAYRNGAAFMFHDGIYQYLRKLKDGVGRPLWADGPNSTPPATLQGYPYFINQDMQSSVATATKTMLFGQLKKYKVRQVNEIRMYRLVERHRENDQDAFLAFVRADGNLLHAGTVPVKHMLQA